MNWNDIDNYILLVASFLSALSAGIGEPTVALIVLAIGMILKAIGSSIDPKYTIVENVDNFALALAGVFAILVTLLAPNTTLTVGIMIAGFLLKGIGSAYIRGGSLAQNVDNIILASGVSISAVLTGFGFIQYAFYVTAIAGFLKAILSNYLRTSTTSPSPTPTPVVVVPASGSA